MAKLSWAGQSCFSISLSPAKDVSCEVVIDPYDDSIGLKLPNLAADLALITHDHKDHNNVKGLKGTPMVIDGPGEYESKGVFIHGINSAHDDSQGKERGRNTIYTIEAEGIRFCHLGDLGQHQLTDEQLDKIGTIDILMVPVGGTFTIDAAAAQKVVSQVDPKIVIPMHYSIPKLKVDLDDVSKFLKAMGKGSVTPTDKLNLKAKDLPKEGAMEVVVLQP